MSNRLPLFPLPNVVLFPGMMLPLHIFEPRYRTMMNDVLNQTQTFGIVLCKTFDSQTMEGDPFDVGTSAEIINCHTLPDGRLNILVTGKKRFQVTHYDATSRPYLTGEVTWLDDADQNDMDDIRVKKTAQLFQDVLRLSHKVLEKPVEPLVMPQTPTEISYFIAEHLRGSLLLKQELLEIPSTQERLTQEETLLTQMVQQLSLRAQIEDVFKTT